MRTVIAAGVAIAVGCSDHATQTIDASTSDSSSDASLDAGVDAPAETGFRVYVATTGARRAVEVTLDTSTARRHVVASGDGTYRFPGRFDDGTSYTITLPAGSPCVLVGGAGAITGADVTAQLYCPGIVELANVQFAFPFTYPYQSSPAFDPGHFTFGGERPFLVEASDSIQVTPTAAYPQQAMIELYGATTPSGLLSAPHNYDSGPIVRLSHAASGLAATYSFSPTPVLRQEAYVKATNTAASAAFGGGAGWSLNYGNAVSLSGNVLAVGAPGRASDAGGAYVYRRIGTTWGTGTALVPMTAQAGAHFGVSVAIDGDLLVVGAPDETVGGLANAGAAYVFAWNGAAWTQTAKLLPTTSHVSDRFGLSVAISGTTIVVGSPLEDGGAADAGAAYVYVLATTWNFEQRITPSAPGGDRFGWSVGISGNSLVVGAPLEDSSTTTVNSTPNESAADAGAAYVFLRGGTLWSQQAYLKASNSGADDKFGRSVAIDLDRVVVGAPDEDGAANNVPLCGAAYVFSRVLTTWSETQVLRSDSPQIAGQYGSVCAIERNHVVVGASGESGSATGVGGTHDTNAGASGSAYVYRYNGVDWSSFYYIKASNTGAGDNFGSSVAIDGDSFAVGAWSEDSDATNVNGNQTNAAATDSGAVYVFR